MISVSDASGLLIDLEYSQVVAVMNDFVLQNSDVVTSSFL